MRRSFGRGFFMDGLAHLVKSFADFSPGPLERLLAEVHSFRQKAAALVNSVSVRTVLQLNTLGFEKGLQVLKNFVFLYRFHNRSIAGQFPSSLARQQLQAPARFIMPAGIFAGSGFWRYKFVLAFPHHHYRAGGMADHPFGGAAHKYMPQSGSAMGPQHDQVGF